MVVFILLVAAILYVLYYLCTSKFNYWQNRKVKHSKPVPLFGNFKDYILLRRPIAEVYDDICKPFSNAPYFGVYYGTEPALVVQDPELIKLICTKDFYYFNSRENQAWMHKDAIGNTITGSSGDRWKVLRKNLSPVFTASKMKKMFHLILHCSKEFELILNQAAKMTSAINGHQLTASYTMSGIASCAFGINPQTMNDKSEQNPFTRSGNLIFQISKFQGLMTIVRSIWPYLYYPFGYTVFPNKVAEFFTELLQKVIEERNHKPSSRNDFLDLLLAHEKQLVGDSMGNSKEEENQQFSIELDKELIMLLCVEVFAAGYETTATTLNRALFELGRNTQAQKKAQEEIDAHLMKHNYKLEYDHLSQLEYLNACVDETLRLHPTLKVVTREVTADYVLPSGLKLEKGLRIHFPTHVIHRNPEYYPDPHKFDPDRFLPGRKENIKPYTYSPFGEGQRICIGMRFAKMEILAGLVTVLKKYDVESEWVPNSHINFLVNIVVPRSGVNFKLRQRVDDHINNFNL